ncbi:MAG: ABC transporter substrate-binding protein [Rhodobacter sp.]|nr:ABC transporter substrate-binding protein [Rhodobacter sp.]MCY4169205.1 ABC transporter substrate-binding protein [Rhodobacter sp.]MCY4241984.1 ABC transporter substrate-binding protein [Rhodobacter sp.]
MLKSTWTKRKTTSLVSATAMVLVMSSSAFAADLKFWTLEEQPDRLAKQVALAADFEAATGIEVEVIPVTESEVGTRATAAYAAGDLPDIINHTVQFTLPWAEAGILDVDANSDAIEALDAGTFAPGPLEMAAFSGGYASVPSDGWTQLLVYRKDLLAEAGMDSLVSFGDIEAFMAKVHNPPEMYGFVVATKVDETYLTQLVEVLLQANGATPVDGDGYKPMDEAKLIETLDFYKALVENSPPGELYWKQARELYFAGKTAAIIWSPFIMDELAGLRDSAPPTINDDPQSRELAGLTGFGTTLRGPSREDAVGWSDVRYLGITSDADTDKAIKFIEFALSEGYDQILGIAPEGKFPVRAGTVDEPSKYQDIWATLPVGVDRRAPLGELYPEDVIAGIVAGLEVGQRWGVTEGQLATASKILNSQVLNRLFREYADGVRSAEETAKIINEELSAL